MKAFLAHQIDPFMNLYFIVNRNLDIQMARSTFFVFSDGDLLPTGGKTT